jgi:hypothetical protein
MDFSNIRSIMRVSIGLLTIPLAAGCLPDRSAAGAAGSAESAQCARDVGRARQVGGDSIFADARGLVQSCPDALAIALAALWADPIVTPERSHQLRAVSAVLRDERLVAAIEAAVRNPAHPIETRLEGLSTLSYYLEAGRWVEFVLLKNQPDSASLRMFIGISENPIRGEGSHAIPPANLVQFRQILETLSQRDTSSAIRSASRRLLPFVDAALHPPEPSQPQKQPPATPAPPGS